MKKKRKTAPLMQSINDGSIEHLVLDKHYKQEDLERFCLLIPENSTIKKITISSQVISSYFACCLGDAIRKCSSLHVIEFSKNKIDSEAADQMAFEIKSHQSVHHVIIHKNNKIKREDADKLVQATINHLELEVTVPKITLDIPVAIRWDLDLSTIPDKATLLQRPEGSHISNYLRAAYEGQIKELIDWHQQHGELMLADDLLRIEKAELPYRPEQPYLFNRHIECCPLDEIIHRHSDYTQTLMNLSNWEGRPKEFKRVANYIKEHASSLFEGIWPDSHFEDTLAIVNLSCMGKGPPLVQTCITQAKRSDQQPSQSQHWQEIIHHRAADTSHKEK